MRSLPPKPLRVSLPPAPQITSRRAVPRRTSSLPVPLMVQASSTATGETSLLVVFNSTDTLSEPWLAVALSASPLPSKSAVVTEEGSEPAAKFAGSEKLACWVSAVRGPLVDSSAITIIRAPSKPALNTYILALVAILPGSVSEAPAARESVEDAAGYRGANVDLALNVQLRRCKLLPEPSSASLSGSGRLRP